MHLRKGNGESSGMMIDEAYLYKYMPAAERILLAALPADEDLNHKFSRRFERKMKALIKNVGRTPAERKFYSGMRIAFVAIAITILIAFGSAMSVKASRHCIIEFLIEVFTDKTSYSVQEEKPLREAVVPVELGYVPKGYEMKQRLIDAAEFFVTYENSQGNRIYYSQSVPSMLGRYWDTEDGAMNVIQIGRETVNVVEKDGEYTLFWNDENYVYRIVGIGDVAYDDLIKMARSIVKK